MFNLQDFLHLITIEGKHVKLPDILLDRSDYLDVKEALELIGGKWSKKSQSFVFKEDPIPLINDLKNGVKRHIKKEFQYYPTPDHLCDYLVSLANLQPHNTVLEPSAGQGSIVKAIRAVHTNISIDCYELMQLNKEILLSRFPDLNFLGDDFLMAFDFKTYDRIIANPPFTKNSDIDHVKKMYQLLNSQGLLITLMSTSWLRSSFKKAKEFKSWVASIKGEYQVLPRGLFSESGTTIETLILVIKKDKTDDSVLIKQPFICDELPKDEPVKPVETQEVRPLEDILKELIELENESSFLHKQIVENLTHLMTNNDF